MFDMSRGDCVRISPRPLEAVLLNKDHGIIENGVFIVKRTRIYGEAGKCLIPCALFTFMSWLHCLIFSAISNQLRIR